MLTSCLGQRYNIIVEANPVNNTADRNFWIRTSPAPNCTHFNPNNTAPDERTGIVRYTVNADLPTTSTGKFLVDCADETYFRKITPIVPWSVSKTRTRKAYQRRTNISSKTNSISTGYVLSQQRYIHEVPLLAVRYEKFPFRTCPRQSNVAKL